MEAVSEEEIFKIATSYLGLSSSQFYEMTYKELSLMMEGKIDKFKNDIEIQSTAIKVAIINAMNKKNYKVFKNTESKEIDPEEKKKTLKELEKIFSW